MFICSKVNIKSIYLTLFTDLSLYQKLERLDAKMSDWEDSDEEVGQVKAQAALQDYLTGSSRGRGRGSYSGPPRGGPGGPPRGGPRGN